MPMGEEDFEFGNVSWDKREQLFMMEILVDQVKVHEDNALAAACPVLPTLLKVHFADLPVMSIERDDFTLAEKMEPDDLSTVTIHDKLIKGAPDEWTVRKAGASYYSVEMPMAAKPSLWNLEELTQVKVLVPRMVVAAGEGLRYILAALKARGDQEVLNIIEHQITQQLKRMQETGESNVVTQHKFASGKSCLFHMTPGDLIASLQEYPIKIQVYRSCTEGDEFVNTLIGEAHIPLGLSFTKAVLLANTPVLLPVAAHVEDVFPIMDSFGRQSGTVCVFVRLSCFGASVFQQEEDWEQKKQRFLKSVMSKDEAKYSGFGETDLKYPWKGNLNAVKDRPAPRPRLQPMYEPLPPPPPPPLPPFDMGQYLPELPRCSPITPPPCYRRAGDRPFSSCKQDMQRQLQREALTKGAQTEPATTPQAHYSFGLAGGSPSFLAPPTNDACTCPTIPPELRPQTTAPNQKTECTCAALIQTLGPTPQMPAEQASFPLAAEPPRVPEPPALGDSDYELNLTKVDCGLENQPVNLPTEVSKEATIAAESPPRPEGSRLQVPREDSDSNLSASVRNAPKDDIVKQDSPRNESPVPKDEEKPPSVITGTTKQEENYDNEMEFDENEDEDEKKETNDKRKPIYVQTAGMYPGRHVGHKHCLVPQRTVPKSMGWLWTAVTFNGLLKGHGWRPGSIRKDVTSIMKSFRADNSEDEESEPKPGKAHTMTKRFRPYSAKSQQPKKTVEKTKPSPTLHIHKKEGYIYVSMIPTKTDSQEEAGEEPKPIQFKIDPKHPDGVEDGDSCYSSSSSSSDVKSYEMDFIAPIALKKRKVKVDKRTIATQYNELDFMKKQQRKKVPPVPPPKTAESKKKGKGKDKKGKGKGKGKGKRK